MPGTDQHPSASLNWLTDPSPVQVQGAWKSGAYQWGNDKELEARVHLLPSVFASILSVIPSTSPMRWAVCYPHFTDGEAEAQNGSVIVPKVQLVSGGAGT